MRIISIFFLLVVLTHSTYAQKGYEWKQATTAGYTYKYVSNDPMGTCFYTLKMVFLLSYNRTKP